MGQRTLGYWVLATILLAGAGVGVFLWWRPVVETPPLLLFDENTSLKLKSAPYRVPPQEAGLIQVERMRQVQPFPAALRALEEATTSRPARLRVRLFDDVAFDVDLRPRDPVVPGGRMWSGGSDEHGPAYVRIVSRPSGRAPADPSAALFLGTVRTPDGRWFRLRGSPGDPGFLVQELLLPSDDECAVDDRAFVPRLPPDVVFPAQVKPVTIDVLVAYTEQARDEAALQVGDPAGSDAAILESIADAFAEAQDAFAQSQIVHSLALAGTYLAKKDSERGDLTGIAKVLQAPKDGRLDDVLTQRDKVKADLVSLLVSSPGMTGCGYGYIMSPTSTKFHDWAVSVVPLGCTSVGYYSLPHELAHNIGCCHAYGDSGAGLCAQAHAHGMRFTGNKGSWRTVMAYPDPKMKVAYFRIARFSNPLVDYDGQPTGTKNEHNAKAIDDNGATVAGFR